MRTIILSLLICLWSVTGQAQLTLGPDTKVVFASVEEGRQVLMTADDFVQQLSPFDRAARIKTDQTVTTAEFLEHVGQQVLPWEEAEVAKVSAAYAAIQDSLESWHLPLPATVYIIKTTGHEEGGAAYTRANAIVFPQGILKASQEHIQKLICHELFHVISRANPELREQMYASIGFVQCGELEFPAELKSRKLTNPDAPRNDHCIAVKIVDQDQWAIPVLYSREEKYDLERGGEFLHYLEFRFMVVDFNSETRSVSPRLEAGTFQLIPVSDMTGFFEQVGNNTGYIFHPEEILADNFMYLVTGKTGLPSPQVVQRMATLLKDDQ